MRSSLPSLSQIQPTMNGDEEARDEPGEDDPEVAVERDRRRHEDDRVDGRRGKEEGEGDGRLEAPVDEGAGDGDGGALAPGEHDAGETGHGDGRR